MSRHPNTEEAGGTFGAFLSWFIVYVKSLNEIFMGGLAAFAASAIGLFGRIE